MSWQKPCLPVWIEIATRNMKDDNGRALKHFFDKMCCLLVFINKDNSKSLIQSTIISNHQTFELSFCQTRDTSKPGREEAVFQTRMVESPPPTATRFGSTGLASAQITCEANDGSSAVGELWIWAWRFSCFGVLPCFFKRLYLLRLINLRVRFLGSSKNREVRKVQCISQIVIVL